VESIQSSATKTTTSSYNLSFPPPLLPLFNH
jgi:hypothetical protein